VSAVTTQNTAAPPFMLAASCRAPASGVADASAAVTTIMAAPEGDPPGDRAHAPAHVVTKISAAIRKARAP
jgi:hypothetical protein